MDTFDYIIVGAGSAGCVLAYRLAEDGKNSILLLEAGGSDRHPNVDIPAAFSKLFKTSRDWDLETVPQGQLGGRRLYQPRGKMLGGSSSINAMLYIRGHRADYDDWAAQGNKGWSYAEVLPYFKRSEAQRDIVDGFHGQDGPLPVGNGNHYHPASHRFVDAGEELGFARNPDFNGAEQEGFGLLQSTTKDGKRASTSASFLRKAERWPNLEVRKKAYTTKVNIKDGQANGVIYRQGNTEKTVTARKEVILCAGAFHSPFILLHSGVGDAKTLGEHGIEVKHHLPGVGQNLQDHLVYPVCFAAKRGSTIDDLEWFPKILSNLSKYLLTKKGPFSSTIAEASAFVRTTPELTAPDIQFHFGPAIFKDHGFNRPKAYGYSIGPTLLTPFSKGTIGLANNDPMAAPQIDPNYLDDKRDLTRLIAGGRLAQKLGLTAAFAPIREGFFQPGRLLETDQEWEDYIRENVQIIYHPVGTCKMGQGADAVVDNELRVQGLKGLRVVDASIMPNVPRGNTNAPTIMIAERAADFILGKPALAAEEDLLMPQSKQG